MTVYQEVTNLSKPYLGPAAEQFISKQCQSFLKIDPQSLAKQHLKDLAKWVEVGATRFMDENKAKELAGKIAKA
jgi:hypothetical protein